MEKEFYGNGSFNGNDSDASGKPFPSTFNSSEEQQISEGKEKETWSEYTTAKGKIEKYYLYFSSWL